MGVLLVPGSFSTANTFTFEIHCHCVGPGMRGSNCLKCSVKQDEEHHTWDEPNHLLELLFSHYFIIKSE